MYFLHLSYYLWQLNTCFSNRVGFCYGFFVVVVSCFKNMLRRSLTLQPSLILLCNVAVADDSFLTSDPGKYFAQLFLSGLVIYTLITFQNFKIYFHLRFIFNVLSIC